LRSMSDAAPGHIIGVGSAGQHASGVVTLGAIGSVTHQMTNAA
jgi:hypothetical protein